LRAATLVADGNAGALVDPARRGASACMGDSGGPVARFDGRRYVLVGIIERASNPSPTRACGDRTHYVSVGGLSAWSGTTSAATDAPVRPRRHARARSAAPPSLRAMREPYDRDRGS
jgi:secreted trypsin-like serine protease